VGVRATVFKGATYQSGQKGGQKREVKKEPKKDKADPKTGTLRVLNPLKRSKEKLSGTFRASQG
jgi:hypothetical protein